MIIPSRPLRTFTALLAACALVTGCAGVSSRGHIRETELAIIPTESSVSFSKTAQEEIASLGLSAEQLGDPNGLESNEKLAGLQSAAQRSLLISEAWYLRGQNDLDVPLPVSLERFLRASHYSYEGLFGESGCQEPTAQLCRDLATAYNRSVREVARLTNNGRQPPSPGDTRYIVDLQADHDPMTLTEWEVHLDNEPSASSPGALGAVGTGCQSLATESAKGRHNARQCVPLAFLVTFDERVTDERARAHLAAFNTLEQSDIPLHSRTVTLSAHESGPWTEIFSPAEEALSCLGNAHPALPTVIFLTPTTQASYEWPVIGSTLAKDPVLRDHYNFCFLNADSSDPSTAQGGVETLAGALTTLLPRLESPAPVILITQGSTGDAIAKNLKGELKNVTPGATAPLNVAGTLSFPATPPLAPNTLPAPISSTTELSRSGASALSDSKRLLTRLANDDDSTFNGLTRSSLSSTDERLSPVM
jgi:hypothetical protein